jgi:hypothetical protein
MKWTKANRAKLHSFRTAQKCDPTPLPEDLWRACCGYVELLKIGGAEPFARTATEVVDEMHSDQPPATLEPSRELYRHALVSINMSDAPVKWDEWQAARVLVVWWAQKAGAEFVVDLLFQEAVMEVKSTMSGTVAAFGEPGFNQLFPDSIRRMDGTLPAFPHDYPIWWALRLHIDDMSEERSASLSRHVQTYFDQELPLNSDSTDWRQRSSLCFAMARDKALIAAQVQRMQAAYTGENAWAGLDLLYPAVPSVELARSLVSDKFPRGVGSMAWDIAEAFGSDAKELLQTIIDKSKKEPKSLKHEMGALKLVSK